MASYSIAERPVPSPVPPEHVAIIMDGNGRWAKQRGLPRSSGHKAGVEAVHKIVEATDIAGIKYLTLYAFSSENWRRPAKEVGQLMALLKIFIRRDLARLNKMNVKIKVIGGRDDLPRDIAMLLNEAENTTAANNGLNLVVAFNYGGRGEITRALGRILEKVEAGEIDARDIDEDLVEEHLDTAGIPGPDLVIRTSGEERLSNFLTWQSAYAELVFVDTYWPDFSPGHLRAAIDEFTRRERRFGGLPLYSPGASPKR